MCKKSPSNSRSSGRVLCIELLRFYKKESFYNSAKLTITT